jgi:hypothetical protein
MTLLDAGDAKIDTAMLVVSLHPGAVRQLLFLRQILAPTLAASFSAFSALPALLDRPVERGAFVESVRTGDTGLDVVDALQHLGIVRVDPVAGLVSLADPWNAADAVQALVCQMAKFVQ